MESLKALLNGMDLEKFMPDLSTFLGKVETICRICVMIAPLILLGLGLLYFLAAPKEANYKLGYRFFWGMSGIPVWQFMQKLAGIVWSLLGLTLCIVITVLSSGFRELSADEMAYRAIRYLLWELGCTLVSILLIDGAVVACFDRKGEPRPFMNDLRHRLTALKKK